MQNDTIKTSRHLLYQAEMIGGKGEYQEAINKLNEAINHLVYFPPSEEQQYEKISLLHNCFFIAGRYYFELKNFSTAIENFIIAKIFATSKDDKDRLDGWIDGSLDEYEFLLKEPKTKDKALAELDELQDGLFKNNIPILPRIEELFKQYG
jgi:tetratricopeptide (TPR) repeat protein